MDITHYKISKLSFDLFIVIYFSIKAIEYLKNIYKYKYFKINNTYKLKYFQIKKFDEFSIKI